MKTLIGGAVAAVLGVIGLAVWWHSLFTIIRGTMPILLLLGGCLAIYLGFDELKDTWKKGDAIDTAPVQGGDDIDTYKKEINDLKQEIDSLKSK